MGGADGVLADDTGVFEFRDQKFPKVAKEKTWLFTYTVEPKWSINDEHIAARPIGQLRFPACVK
jgi:hypothetical protein